MKKIKILIVDDEESSRLLITYVMRFIGHDAIYAINGPDAIEICKNNSDIDLILMDLMMPVMDGNEAIKKLENLIKT